MPKSKFKIPSKINDLLTRDDINQILRDMDKEKSSIKTCLILYINRKGELRGRVTEDTPVSILIWMMESYKLTLLAQGSKDEEETDGKV